MSFLFARFLINLHFGLDWGLQVVNIGGFLRRIVAFSFDFVFVISHMFVS